MNRWRHALLALLALAVAQQAAALEPWFESFKARATPQQLYTFLYALPKGGDLHNHLTGAVRSEWYWDAAIASADRGYFYYTKTRIDNCVPYGNNEYGLPDAVRDHLATAIRGARCLPER
jgi:adenosine deaminase CECR1